MGYINFYTIVTVLFIIIIVSLIIWISTSFKEQTSPKSNSKSNTISTYTISNCPDYWIDDLGDGTKCISTGSNITDQCFGTMDFSGNSCEKLKKSLPCTGMIWDGITYGNNSKVSLTECNIVNPVTPV
jgi:hypothetical protein